VKKVNKENSKINKRLNSVKCMVPTADSLIKHEEINVNAQRKFASRYSGLKPEDHIAKQANNRLHKQTNKEVKDLEKSISQAKLS
jgi:hypothetical protein